MLSTYSYGITSVFKMAVNSYILFYIYKINVPEAYKRVQSIDACNGGQDLKTDQEINDTAMIDKFNLTEREVEILRLAYSGLTNPEIGDKLSISKHTAKRHMHNIFNKMDVSTRLEMVHIVNETSRKNVK